MARYMFDAAGRIQNGILYVPSLRQEMAAPLLLSKAIDYIGRYRDIISGPKIVCYRNRIVHAPGIGSK